MRKILIFILFATSCASAQIETVLKQDREISQTSFGVKEMTQRMRQIDLSRCPDDFKEAYVRHIHAWDDVARQEEERDSSTFKTFLGGIISAFMGRPDLALGAAVLMLREKDPDKSEVYRTWHEIETIATKHGAKITRASKDSKAEGN